MRVLEREGRFEPQRSRPRRPALTRSARRHHRSRDAYRAPLGAFL